MTLTADMLAARALGRERFEADREEFITNVVQHCRYCKAAATRRARADRERQIADYVRARAAGGSPAFGVGTPQQPPAMCESHRDHLRAMWATSPASDSYWQS